MCTSILHLYVALLKLLFLDAYKLSRNNTCMCLCFVKIHGMIDSFISWISFFSLILAWKLLILYKTYTYAREPTTTDTKKEYVFEFNFIMPRKYNLIEQWKFCTCNMHYFSTKVHNMYTCIMQWMLNCKINNINARSRICQTIDDLIKECLFSNH